MASRSRARAVRLARLVPAAALLLSLSSAPGTASDHRCLSQARAELAGLGLAPSEIVNVSVVRIVGSTEIGNVLEYQAWTTLRSCTGSIVTRMSPTCRVIVTYGRGNCSGRITEAR